MRVSVTWILFLIVLNILPLKEKLHCSAASAADQMEVVNVFHLIDNALWGETDGSTLQGKMSCPQSVMQSISCNFFSSDVKHGFLDALTVKLKNQSHTTVGSKKALQVSLYNIHTWGIHSPPPHYPSCLLPTDLTMIESEESHRRFKKLFGDSFPLYDGNSTTSPYSTVQRSYIPKLNMSEFLPLRPFAQSISGASFVASTCHKGGGTNNRESIVLELSKTIRVDGLGKCMKTSRKDSAVLTFGKTAQETLYLKQKAISHYLFYLAFENTNEPGYITEKVLDALIAGTVPVYYGDSAGCKKILPHPRAAIFVDDFTTTEKLAEYLLYLSRNATAYDEHRMWRQHFDLLNQASIFDMSWPCAVCHWASRTNKENLASKNYLSWNFKKRCA